MSTQLVSVLKESVGAVRILTLNRPEKLNAAHLEMQQRLVAGVREVTDDSDARVLILTGAGRAFSAGGDRETLAKIAAGDFAEKEEFGQVHLDTIDCLLKLPIPSIAAVNGPAVGYAAGLVALCDMVVMGEDAFLSDPHVKYGIPATTATQLIWPKLTSQIVAKELLMSGRQVGAEEAVEIGLANRLCPTEKVMDTALELAQEFIDLPPGGVNITKRLFNQNLLDEAEELMALTTRLLSDEGR